jgi:hypothetical protein
VGGGDVADAVVIVSRVDASRELQGKLGEDMGSGSVLVCLYPVLKTRELPLEPMIPATRLVHTAHHKLTLTQRHRRVYYLGC